MPLFRSPNGQGLVLWPKYGAGEEYLQVQAKEQVVRHQMKKDRFTAFTKTIPKKAEQHSKMLAPLFTLRRLQSNLLKKTKGSSFCSKTYLYSHI